MKETIEKYLPTPEKISPYTMLEARAPAPGEALIYYQRHGKYNTKTGHLNPEYAFAARENAHTVLSNLFEQIPQEERESVTLVVEASPTNHLSGRYLEGRRAVETAEEVIQAVKEVLIEQGLTEGQLFTMTPKINNLIGGPDVFIKTPEYVQWLLEQTGQTEVNQAVFAAYESDSPEVRKVRKEMGAEGPWDMAYRLMEDMYDTQERTASYLNENPSHRVVVWKVGHYDMLSPLAKLLSGNGDLAQYIAVDYLGGFGVNVESTVADGSQAASKVSMGGVVYPVNRVDLPSLTNTDTASSTF